MPTSSSWRAGGLGLDLDRQPERDEQIRAAGARRDRPVAVLGDGRARGRRHERGGGRDVERSSAVAAGAAGVHDIRELVRHGAHARPHRFDGARDLFGSLALHRQGDEQRRDLALGELAVHDPSEERRHLVAPQVLAVEEALQEPRRFDHPGTRVPEAPPARACAEQAARKLVTIRGPATVNTDSGWNWTPQ